MVEAEVAGGYVHIWRARWSLLDLTSSREYHQVGLCNACVHEIFADLWSIYQSRAHNVEISYDF